VTDAALARACAEQRGRGGALVTAQPLPTGWVGEDRSIARAGPRPASWRRCGPQPCELRARRDRQPCWRRGRRAAGGEQSDCGEPAQRKPRCCRPHRWGHRCCPHRGRRRCPAGCPRERLRWACSTCGWQAAEQLLYEVSPVPGCCASWTCACSRQAPRPSARAPGQARPRACSCGQVTRWACALALAPRTRSRNASRKRT